MNIFRPAFYLSCSIFLCNSCMVKEEKRPNFIIIQADDLGFDDLGSSGNKIVSTPNLDQLAEQSMRFSNFYVNPVCAPTRASFLTGRFFLRTGVSHVHGGKDFLNLNEQTIADVLRSHGYATGMWGKWHSGHTEGYFPWQRGFEEAYMAQLYVHENSYGRLNGEEVFHDKWADEVITDYTTAFIARNHEQGTPFFAYLSHLTCHSPLSAPNGFIEPYRTLGLSENLSTLYGMISFVDQELGAFFQTLDSIGALENTYILFMSDNGPAVLNDLLTDDDRDLRYINNYNGHKGNIWENGVKSPLFIYRKNFTRAGTYQHLTDITDIFPTILNLAGLSLPESNPELDGKSFAALIKSTDAADSVAYSIFNYAHRAWQPTKQPWTPMGTMDEYRPVELTKDTALPFDDQAVYIRNQRFKLLQNPAGYQNTPEQENNWVLIDMKSDPKEQNNVYQKYPEVAESMEAELKAWYSSILLEEGSFKMPFFFISAAHGNEIPAKAPYEISAGLKNAFSALGEWKHAGDYAIYKIKDADRGEYKIRLAFENELKSKRIFKLFNQTNSAIFCVESGHVTGDSTILFSLNDTILKLELIEIRDSSNESAWLKSINLTSID